MFAPFSHIIINDSLLQPMQQLSQQLLRFTNITDPLLIAAALFSRSCGH